MIEDAFVPVDSPDPTPEPPPDPDPPDPVPPEPPPDPDPPDPVPTVLSLGYRVVRMTGGITGAK